MYRRSVAASALWQGEMLGVTVGSCPVVLINLEGVIYAYDDRCPHQRVPLSQGKLCGNALTCSAHEWQYEVCTGLGINPRRSKLRPYSAKIEDGYIWVDIDSQL